MEKEQLTTAEKRKLKIEQLKARLQKEESRLNYTKAAVQGNADAQYNLGVMYARGRGVQQDYEKARIWLEKAAAQGNTYALALLSVLYLLG